MNPISFRQRPLIAIAGLLVVASTPAFAVDLAHLPTDTWVETSPVYAGAPYGGGFNPQSWNNKQVYDPVSQRVIVFDRWDDPVHNGAGADFSASIYANALLAFDPTADVVSVLKIGNWVNVSTIACETCARTIALPENETEPTPLDRHPFGAFALASDFGKAYISTGANQGAKYGGDFFGAPIADTWAFDLAHARWSQVSGKGTAQPNPPNTYGSALMAYDAANRVVVQFVDDGFGPHTYVLDPATDVWRALPQDPSALPVHTVGAGIAYDSRRQRLVIYAGQWEGGLTSLWAYTVADNHWTPLADCPVPAPAPGFDYDSNHDIFLALVDGTQTWIYDPVADAWSLVDAPLHHAVPIHHGQPVTYDPAHDVFVFSGGNAGYAAPQWSVYRYAGGATLPTITAQPSDASVIAGQAAIFSVLAAGSPAPTYRWQTHAVGGSVFTDVPGATSAVYTLAAATLTDSGLQLRCIATNSQGTVTSTVATLSVSDGGSTTGSGTTGSGTTGSGTTGGGTAAGGTTSGTGSGGSTHGGTGRCGAGFGAAAVALALALFARDGRRSARCGLVIAAALCALAWSLPAADTNVLLSEDGTFTTQAGAPEPLTISVVDQNHPTLVLGPVPTVDVYESSAFDVIVRADSASGGAVIAATGLPGSSFIEYGSPAVARWVWYTGYSDEGTYTGTLTASDAAGHHATTTLTLRVHNQWHADQLTHLSCAPVPAQAAPAPIVRGTTPFALIGKDKYGNLRAIPPTLVYQYLLDDQPIGAWATGDVQTPIDLAAVPDGTHTLGMRLIDGPLLDQYFLQLLQIVVDNQPGPVTGPQRIPLMPWYFGSRFDPPAADWVTWSGVRGHQAAQPLSYRRSDPASLLGDPSVLLASANWFAEPLTQEISGLYAGSPSFYSDARGDIITHGFYPQGLATAEASFEAMERFDDHDGPRDDNSVSPYGTFVPDPAGPGWVGVDIAGSLRRVGADGSVTTIAGYQRRTDVVAYDYTDPTIPIGSVHADKEVLLGNFVGNVPLRMPIDLAFDPRDATHRTIYVADTGNHRIAKVVLGSGAPVITTVVGQPRVQGYRDGAADQALLSSPYSIVFAPDGSLYIADLMNCAIRELSADGATIATIAGGSLAPAVPAKDTVMSNKDAWIADGTVSQATVNYPQVVRLDSDHNLVFGEDATGTIRRLDLATGRIELIHVLTARGAGWIWLDVDWRGNVGPRDDILVTMDTGGNGNTEAWRYSKDGSRGQPIFSGITSSLHTGQVTGLSEAAGHYPWAIAIDDEEARIITSGLGNSGLMSLRRFLPGDPVFSCDFATLFRGFELIRTGTAMGFPFGSRPALSVIHGPTGHSRLGMVPDFDELAYWSDGDLADYIHAGMGGSVPRPEITGNDLAALIYTIRYLSLRSNLETIPVPALDPDTTAPAIRGIQVAQVDPHTARVRWQSDEPTLGLVQWGLSDAYHGWSEMESGYGTDHSVLLRQLPSDRTIHYSLRAKDLAGNQSTTADQSFVLDPAASGGAPASFITGVGAGGLGQTTATIAWDTTSPATSQVEYGFNQQYGQLTATDPSPVTHHVVTLTGLVPGTLYHYRTISANRALSVADTDPPSVPTGLVLGDATTSTLHLGWTPSTDDVGVIGYRLQLALDAGFTALVAGYGDLDLGSATTRTIGGLAAGTTYYARVRAYDATPNLSAWSASAHAATSGAGGGVGGGGGSGYGRGGHGGGCGAGFAASAVGMVLALSLRGRGRRGGPG